MVTTLGRDPQDMVRFNLDYSDSQATFRLGSLPPKILALGPLLILLAISSLGTIQRPSRSCSFRKCNWLKSPAGLGSPLLLPFHKRVALDFAEEQPFTLVLLEDS